MFPVNAQNVWHIVGNVSIGGGITAPAPRSSPGPSQGPAAPRTDIHNKKRRQRYKNEVPAHKKSRPPTSTATTPVVRLPSFEESMKPVNASAGLATDTNDPLNSETQPADILSTPNLCSCAASSGVKRCSAQTQTEEQDALSPTEFPPTSLVNYAMRVGRTLLEDRYAELLKGINLTKEVEKGIVGCASKNYRTHEEEFDLNVEETGQTRSLMQRFFSLVSDSLLACFSAWCGFKSLSTEVQEAIVQAAKDAVKFASSIVMKMF